MSIMLSKNILISGKIDKKKENLMASKRREATLRRRYEARVQIRLTPTTAGVGTGEQHLFDDDEGELTSELFKTIR